MSKTDIWMPLYIGDYLADTGRLTTLQHGAYLLLLMDYWRTGPLPDSDKQLATISRVSIQCWITNLRTPLRSFFTIGEDGLLHQKRMDIERDHAIDLSEKRRIAGMKRAPRSAKPNGSNGMDPEHKTGSNSSSNSSSNSYRNSPSNSDCNSEYTRASRASALPSPSQLQEERTSLRLDAGASNGARDWLWSKGLQELRQVTGLPERKARGLLGKLCGLAKDDCTIIRRALAEVVSLGTGDPISWLMKAVQQPQFRDGFLQIIADEGIGAPLAEPDDAVSQFLRMSGGPSRVTH